MILRKEIRVQFGNQKEIDFEIERIKKHYPSDYIIKPSLKPVKILDNITNDCLMLIDIIY